MSSETGGDPQPLIAVGVIRKAHGVRGEASVELWTDSFERFLELREVFLVSPDGTERIDSTIASAREHGGRALLKFEGIESPEALQPFRNWTVEIPAGQSRTLDEGEYFLHDLVGLEVADPQGERLGVVSEVSEGGGGLILTVVADGATQDSEGGNERSPSFDVPFAASICTGIDLEKRRMVVDLPEGLRDLTGRRADGAKRVFSRQSSHSEAAESVVAGKGQRAGAEPAGTPMRFDVVTIFPKMFEALSNEGVVARGIKSGRIVLRVWDLRDFALDKHRSTDDEPYGGGAGMVMLAEPVVRCVEAIEAEAGGGTDRPLVLLTSPQGAVLDQSTVVELSRAGWLILLCGRYEGFDERVKELLSAREISVGDFVVSGGELPAMVVVDAISRMVEGVVGDRNSVEADSFYNGLLDYPHYTRPAEFRGLQVPDVLLSGHAEKIRQWRKEQSVRATAGKRPELLQDAALDDETKRMLEKIGQETGSESIKNPRALLKPTK